jgi:hypothetical protein
MPDNRQIHRRIRTRILRINHPEQNRPVSQIPEGIDGIPQTHPALKAPPNPQKIRIMNTKNTKSGEIISRIKNLLRIKTEPAAQKENTRTPPDCQTLKSDGIKDMPPKPARHPLSWDEIRYIIIRSEKYDKEWEEYLEDHKKAVHALKDMLEIKTKKTEGIPRNPRKRQPRRNAPVDHQTATTDQRIHNRIQTPGIQQLENTAVHPRRKRDPQPGTGTGNRKENGNRNSVPKRQIHRQASGNTLTRRRERAPNCQPQMTTARHPVRHPPV